MRAARIGAVLILAAGFVGWYRRPAPVDAIEAEAETGSAEGVANVIVETVDAGINALIPVRYFMWSESIIPDKYRAAIAAAEDRNGIPANMLARLLYQESRYREDIISGARRSPAGAVGIAQFMPATAAELGVNPYDAFESIDGAGRYLARLYKSLGDWALALAAYNWGIGNVRRKGIASAPTETRNYFTQILADLGFTDGVVV